MTKSQLIQKLYTFGDAVIDFRDRNKEPILVTIILKERYIKNKLRRTYVKRHKQAVIVWSWTDDEIINIDPNTVQRLTPLSKILNNEGAA